MKHETIAPSGAPDASKKEAVLDGLDDLMQRLDAMDKFCDQVLVDVRKKQEKLMQEICDVRKGNDKRNRFSFGRFFRYLAGHQE